MAETLPSILVIVGPTASGKTRLAIEVAKKIPSEIISADSRQIYKHLTIGTAKPSEEELVSVPHHCIDIREPHEKFNAGDFQEFGRQIIADILRRKKYPIVVGGTGLYIRALIDGFFEQPEFAGDIRFSLEDRCKSEGRGKLYAELVSVDPAAAATMDASKYRRVIRALEVYYETGIPISTFHKNHKPKIIYDAYFVGLAWDRKTLYDRINNRVDAMISDGFLDEVKQLLSLGYDDRMQALQTVGYKEAFSFMRKEISFQRMVELMKQNTRRFAKRQLTWFRNENRIRWYDINDQNQIHEIAESIVNSLPR